MAEFLKCTHYRFPDQPNYINAQYIECIYVVSRERGYLFGVQLKDRNDVGAYDDISVVGLGNSILDEVVRQMKQIVSKLNKTSKMKLTEEGYVLETY